jgi:DHA3 family macrolide efflux protein-like MFS transporter
MKNKNAIILLLVSNIISGLAQGISMIAIPWYFVYVIDQADYFAASYLIITFLILFWGLYAGTLIDRYSRKNLFILVNLFCGLFIGLISLYGIINSSLPDIFVILVFGITIFNYHVHYPNLYAFGQEISEKENYGKLNSYIEIQGQVTSVLAGAVAAILLTGTVDNTLQIAGIKFVLPFNIESWEIYEIFLMDSITYLSVIIILSFIRYKVIKKDKIHQGRLFNRLNQGIAYLRSNVYVFIFGITSYILFAFLIVEIHTLLPSYVTNFLEMGGDVYASSEIYYSLGAIVSGVLIIRVFRSLNSIQGILILLLFVALFLALMSYYKTLIIFFIGSFVLGVTNAGIRILRTTYIFHHVPNNLIGRVNSVFGSLNILIRLLLIGVFSLSFFQINDNIRYTYLIGAGIMIISMLILLIYYKDIINKEKQES